MAGRRADTPRLTAEQLMEVMELARASDSIELKLTIPSAAQRTTIASLPLDPVEAQPRQIFFFDTPDLALDQAGIVVRARRIQGGKADTVVKLRPVVPTDLPPDLRRSASFKVEVDVLPGGFVCSGSMKGKTTGQEVRDAVDGNLPLRKIFSKEQRQLFRERAPAGIDLDSLVPLGPTFILKSVFSSPDHPRPFVAELWLYQDGSRILELSTKALPGEAFQAAVEARTFLAKQGIDVTGVQQTKTRTALRFFQKQLDAAAAVR